MNAIQQLNEFLKGKRTIIVSSAMVLYGLAIVLGYVGGEATFANPSTGVSPDEGIGYILEGLGLGYLRAGVSGVLKQLRP